MAKRLDYEKANRREILRKQIMLYQSNTGHDLLRTTKGGLRKCNCKVCVFIRRQERKSKLERVEYLQSKIDEAKGRGPKYRGMVYLYRQELKEFKARYRKRGKR